MNNITPQVSSVPPDAASRHFDMVLRPDLNTLLQTRAARLRQLAPTHELSAYLSLAADVTEARSQALRIASDLPKPRKEDAQHIDPVVIASQENWNRHLDVLLNHLSNHAGELRSDRMQTPVAEQLIALGKLSIDERIAAGTALAKGNFSDVPCALAPFLWAALSLEVALAARSIDIPVLQEEQAYCPLCGSLPVASLIHTGDRQGLRYLHCSLCECQWHMVRAKCTNCGQAGQLDYLSFETAQAPVRAESCSNCHSYLKVISQEKDREAEVVADDLATLALDDAASTEGFGRTGLNPFALPCQ